MACTIFQGNNMDFKSLISKIDHLDKTIAAKRNLAKKYTAALKNIDEISLPIEKNYATNVFWMYGLSGSGKSTLLSNLRKHYENSSNVVFLKEPVDEWEKIVDENGETILKKFYNNITIYCKL